ncbi:MAG: hypothetical protein ACE5HB_07510 [Terriglobia bacterium]
MTRLTLFLPLLLAAWGCAAPAPQTSQPQTGPEIVARMIEAHGGLDKWRSAPTVSFEDTLQLAGAPAPVVARVTVHQPSRRAYLDFPEMGARIAWDSEQAWSEDWKGPLPPRFLALLSYYFANLPWLAADAGVNLGEPQPGRLFDDPTEYITVKMTFDSGAGDTPDDHYILYIDPTDYRLRATGVRVTYAAILPPETEAIEEVLVYDEYATVDGLTVPTKGSVYALDASPLASFEWRDWSFRQPFDESRMVMPTGAVVDTSNRTRMPEQPR